MNYEEMLAGMFVEITKDLILNMIEEIGRDKD